MEMAMAEGQTMEEQPMENNRGHHAELVAQIGSALPRDGAAEPMPGLHLFRLSAPPAEPNFSVSVPAFCVIAQGCKEVNLGTRRYQYDPANYLIATAELPITSQVIEASPERPYLSLRIDLEPALVSSVMVEAGYPASRDQAQVHAMDVSPLDGELMDAVIRLVRLIDTPAEARFLAPLITREIVYRLLRGEQGTRLRHIAVLGGYSHRIVQAIARLRIDFDKPLRIEAMAREFGMSVSGFHHHFKAVTAMSPLQFQKQLRLQEARRLILGDNLDAASAGFRVGYDDASHFNREYKRFFGAPPIRDVDRLRQAVIASPGL
jgi:AraC-like DNA-binding protein